MKPPCESNLARRDDGDKSVGRGPVKLTKDHPAYDEVLARLRCGWSPERIARWMDESLPPDVPRVTWRTLYRLRHRLGIDASLPKRLVDEIVKEHLTDVRVDVAGKEAELLMALEARLIGVIARENEAVPEGASLDERQAIETRKRQARQEFAGLSEQYAELLAQHRETLQSLGMLPKAGATVKVEAAGEVTHHHKVFTFLQPAEAQRLMALEAAVERGEVDVVDLYKSVEGIFKAEQEAHRVKR